jgi:hypothetical protein
MRVTGALFFLLGCKVQIEGGAFLRFRKPLPLSQSVIKKTELASIGRLSFQKLEEINAWQ